MCPLHDSLPIVAGVNDANLVELTRQSGARVALRGDTMTLQGTAEAVERATAVAQRMIEEARRGSPMDADDVLRMAMEPANDGNGGAGGDRKSTRLTSSH